MTDTFTRPGTTGSSEVITTPSFPQAGTKTIEDRAKEIADRAGHVRNATTVMNDDAAAIQLEAFRIQLDARTLQLAKQDSSSLLNELSDMGFAWRDIARMLGVSVPALRRWRQGDRPSADNLRQIAQLLAFAQIIRDDHLVFEPAQWMEVPLVHDAPVTPMDLYRQGLLEIIYDLAADKIAPDSVLDRAIPDWRQRYRSDWEVATDESGERFIRVKPGR